MPRLELIIGSDATLGQLFDTLRGNDKFPARPKLRIAQITEDCTGHADVIFEGPYEDLKNLRLTYVTLMHVFGPDFSEAQAKEIITKEIREFPIYNDRYDFTRSNEE